MVRVFKINNGAELEEIELSAVCQIDGISYISVDGSTSNTGITLLSERSVPLVTISVSSDGLEVPDGIEFAVYYKIFLKSVLKELLIKSPCVNAAFYEEPIVQYVNNVKSLFGLRTVVPEILVEEQITLLANRRKIIYREIPNEWWKKRFLAPEKVPPGTTLQKEAIRRRANQLFPWTLDPRITQDECDSLGMGVVCGGMVFTGQEEELGAKKKVKPFKFEVRFIGAESNLEAVEELVTTKDTWKPKIPSRFEGQTYTITTLSGNGTFEKKVYEIMQDRDELLILKFKSTQYLPALMKYGVSSLTSEYNYVYAVCWRSSRKGGTKNGK